MKVKEKLHAKRALTEKHIQQMKKPGTRYTAHMPDIPFMILGLLSDIGWLIQLISGTQILFKKWNIIIFTDLILIIISIGVTVYLGVIHEKEIALRWQKDMSFGLMSIGGLFGIIAGLTADLPVFIVGAGMNTAGSLPLFLSFQ